MEKIYSFLQDACAEELGVHPSVFSARLNAYIDDKSIYNARALSGMGLSVFYVKYGRVYKKSDAEILKTIINIGSKRNGKAEDLRA